MLTWHLEVWYLFENDRKLTRFWWMEPSWLNRPLIEDYNEKPENVEIRVRSVKLGEQKSYHRTFSFERTWPRADWTSTFWCLCGRVYVKKDKRVDELKLGCVEAPTVSVIAAITEQWWRLYQWHRHVRYFSRCTRNFLFSKPRVKSISRRYKENSNLITKRKTKIIPNTETAHIIILAIARRSLIRLQKFISKICSNR